jgi:hypothetical protein
MNRIQQHKYEMNQHLASMAKVTPLPPAFRHYGDYRTGILKARANGFTNLEIAEEIYKQTGKGPVERRPGGCLGLNRETAATYISNVVNHSSIPAESR